MKHHLILYIVLTIVLPFCSFPSFALDKKRVFSPDLLIEQGDKFFKAEQYSDAVDFYLDAMARAKAIDDIKSQGRIFNKLGLVYVRLNNIVRAIHYMESGFNFAQKCDDKVGMGISAAHLAGLYAFNNDLTNAKIYLQKQKSLPHESEGLKLYFENFNEALICQLEKDFKRSIDLHNKAIRIVDQYGLDIKYPISNYGLMVYISLELGDTKSALLYCEKCKEHSKLIGNRTYLYTYHEMLRDIYSAIGDKAMRDNHAHIADSIYMDVITQKQIESVDNRVVVFEDKQNYREIDLLTDKVNRQLAIIILAVVIILLLVVFVVSIVIYAKKLNSAYKLLVNKNREMRIQDQVSLVLRSRGTEDKPDITSDVLPHDTTDDDDTSQRKDILSNMQARELIDKILVVMEDVAVISNPDFSLNSLAQLVGSNTTYVSWIINNFYQKNFKTFLNEYRIKEACRRLEDEDNYGHLTIQAIFSDLGYSSYSNFVAAFKKINGMTPSQYQKLARTNSDTQI